MSEPDFVTVARVGEIPEGSGRAFEVRGRVIAVFCVQGRYYAIDDMCPHMGASLAEGHLEGDEVACAWHGWRFCVRDGAWCDCRRIKVDTYPVRVLGDQIQVGAAPAGPAAEAEPPDPNDSPTT